MSKELIGEELVMTFTRPITDSTQLHPKVTWGTATLGPDAQVTLRIAGLVEPVQMTLIHPLILGRGSPDQFLEIDVDLMAYDALEKGVSRQHLMIEVMKGVVIITDLGSMNGTYINGQRLSPDQCHIVRDGDEIRLGNLIGNIYF